MISKGMWYMLLASLLFTVLYVFLKLIPHIPAIEVVFFRSFISLTISFGLLKKQKVPVLGKQKGLLLMRGGAGALGLIMIFITVQHIPLATATTLQFLAPIFATLLGIFLVKEKVKPLQFLFFGLAFAGVVLIKGFDTGLPLLYLLLGIGGAFFAGLAYNFIRKLNVREHSLVIIFYFPLVTIPLTAYWVLTDWVQPVGTDWLFLLLIGIITQIAQYFMTKSYQLEELSKVSSLNYISIVYALGFGYFIFDEKFHPATYAGMALVLGGVILNIQYKKRLAEADKNA